MSKVVYGKENCPNCVTLKETLDAKGVTYKYIDVGLEENEDSLQLLKDSGFRGVPVMKHGEGFADFSTAMMLTMRGLLV